MANKQEIFDKVVEILDENDLDSIDKAAFFMAGCLSLLKNMGFNYDRIIAYTSMASQSFADFQKEEEQDSADLT